MRLAVPASVVAIAVSCAAVVFAEVPAGPVFVVNAYTTGTQYRPSVAAGKDDGFIVAWNNQVFPAYEAHARRFDRAGAPIGGDFRLNEHTVAHWPVVSADREGRLAAVWMDGTGIGGRLIDAASAPLGSEFQVSTYATGVPDVFRQKDGRFVVTWSSDGVDGDAAGIVARVFGADGTPLGAEFVVNTYTTGIQTRAVVDGDASGGFVIVWNDRAGADGWLSGIFGRRFSPAGVPIGAEFRVNEVTTGYQDRPAIDVAPNGDFVVAWTSPGVGGTLIARRFDSLATPLGPDIVVRGFSKAVPEIGPGAVSQDDHGNFVAVWSEFGIQGRRVAASGALRGSQFLIGPGGPPINSPPSVHSDPAGNFVVIWDSYTDVLARRYGGLVPTALAVDPTGNGVLEPGETVGVHPSWRSANSTAQTFGAILAGLAGPAGLTYAITDPSADYGTVAPGATASCADCYAVSVSDPPTRPQTHVDATALERIVPDSQGQHKRWTLHVGRSFDDVAVSSPFYRFVETLLHRGVTGGCSATSYCPGAPTTREQMAVFVIVAKDGPGYPPPACGATPMFADVPVTSPFCRWIEELARRGVVSGCGGGNYCPSTNVTREQMAVFVLRTLDPALNPPACAPPNLFADVPETSPFCRWVEELANRSIVTGCGGGNYCPASPVTREQMGVFIGVTFGLTLYGV